MGRALNYEMMRLALVIILTILTSQSLPAEVLRSSGEKVYASETDARILVTGGTAYPLDVIYKNMGLDSESVLQLKGKRVVSVGEGYSDLLPDLLSKDVAAFGMDLWYDQKEFPNNETGKRMKTYVEKYSAQLITASCANVPTKLYGTMDLVLMHQLLNNLSEDDRQRCAQESVAMVRPGGRAVFACLASSTAERISENLKIKHPFDIVTTYIVAMDYEVKNPEPYVLATRVSMPDCHGIVVKRNVSQKPRRPLDHPADAPETTR